MRPEHVFLQEGDASGAVVITSVGGLEVLVQNAECRTRALVGEREVTCAQGKGRRGSLKLPVT